MAPIPLDAVTVSKVPLSHRAARSDRTSTPIVSASFSGTVTLRKES